MALLQPCRIKLGANSDPDAAKTGHYYLRMVDGGALLTEHRHVNETIHRVLAQGVTSQAGSQALYDRHVEYAKERWASWLDKKSRMEYGLQFPELPRKGFRAGWSRREYQEECQDAERLKREIEFALESIPQQLHEHGWPPIRATDWRPV